MNADDSQTGRLIVFGFARIRVLLRPNLLR